MTNELIFNADGTLDWYLNGERQDLISATADRDLDLAILNASGVAHPWRWLDRERETITCDRYGKDATGNPVCGLEHFSSSIDEALTLLPAGYVWGCRFSNYVPHQAWVSSSKHRKGEWIGENDHERAIALSIAILKARRATTI